MVVIVAIIGGVLGGKGGGSSGSTPPASQSSPTTATQYSVNYALALPITVDTANANKAAFIASTAQTLNVPVLSVSVVFTAARRLGESASRTLGSGCTATVTIANLVSQADATATSTKVRKIETFIHYLKAKHKNN